MGLLVGVLAPLISAPTASAFGGSTITRYEAFTGFATTSMGGRDYYSLKEVEFECPADYPWLAGWYLSPDLQDEFQTPLHEWVETDVYGGARYKVSAYTIEGSLRANFDRHSLGMPIESAFPELDVPRYEGGYGGSVLHLVADYPHDLRKAANSIPDAGSAVLIFQALVQAIRDTEREVYDRVFAPGTVAPPRAREKLEAPRLHMSFLDLDVSISSSRGQRLMVDIVHSGLFPHTGKVTVKFRCSKLKIWEPYRRRPDENVKIDLLVSEKMAKSGTTTWVESVARTPAKPEPEKAEIVIDTSGSDTESLDSLACDFGGGDVAVGVSEDSVAGVVRFSVPIDGGVRVGVMRLPAPGSGLKGSGSVVRGGCLDADGEVPDEFTVVRVSETSVWSVSPVVEVFKSPSRVPEVAGSEVALVVEKPRVVSPVPGVRADVPVTVEQVLDRVGFGRCGADPSVEVPKVIEPTASAVVEHCLRDWLSDTRLAPQSYKWSPPAGFDPSSVRLLGDVSVDPDLKPDPLVGVGSDLFVLKSTRPVVDPTVVFEDVVGPAVTRVQPYAGPLVLEPSLRRLRPPLPQWVAPEDPTVLWVWLPDTYGVPTPVGGLRVPLRIGGDMRDATALLCDVFGTGVRTLNVFRRGEWHVLERLVPASGGLGAVFGSLVPSFLFGEQGDQPGCVDGGDGRDRPVVTRPNGTRRQVMVRDHAEPGPAPVTTRDVQVDPRSTLTFADLEPGRVGDEWVFSAPDGANKVFAAENLVTPLLTFTGPAVSAAPCTVTCAVVTSMGDADDPVVGSWTFLNGKPRLSLAPLTYPAGSPTATVGAMVTTTLAPQLATGEPARPLVRRTRPDGSASDGFWGGGLQAPVAVAWRSWGPSGTYSLPVSCDWNGDGLKTTGEYYPANQNGWQVSNGAPWVAEYLTAVPGKLNRVTFGPSHGRPYGKPVCGDWDGDGTETPGLFMADPVSHTATWYLTNTDPLNAPYGSTLAVHHTFTFGTDTDLPVAGDWDGDGIDSVGYMRPNTATNATASTWMLAADHAGGAPLSLQSTVTYTHARPVTNPQPVTGDWAGDGTTGIGVAQNGHWQIRHTPTTGPPTHEFGYGQAGDTYLTW